MTSAHGQIGSGRERLVGVQYLRALAALQVLTFHTSGLAGHDVQLGNFGVPLFFIISGFIMVIITGAEARPLPFLRDRAARILPLYWIVTTLAAVAVALSAPLSLRYLAASYLFLPWPRPGVERHLFPVHEVGWTLNYEMFFYTLFALTLMVPARWRLIVLSALFGALVVAGFAVRWPPGPVQFWTQPVILQFLAGAWIGRWWQNRGALLWPLLGLAAGYGLVFVPALHHFQTDLWHGIWPAAMLIAVLWAHRSGWLGRDIPSLRLLGDASYSIYLFHPLVLRALGAAGLRPWLFILLGVALSVCAGLLCHLLIERPLLRAFHLRRRKLGVTIPAGP